MTLTKPFLLTFLVFSLAHLAVGSDTADATLDRKIRETALAREPAILDLPIGWHEIRGLKGQWAWHILGTMWRVRLHPDTRGLERLDKAKEYEVHGVALEQNYGVIDVWVYDLKRK